MSRIEELTSLEAAVRLTGHRIPRLRPQDAVVKVTTADDRVTVLIRRVSVRETFSETRFTAANLELIEYRRGTGCWTRESLTIPDAAFVPWVRHERGCLTTPEAHRDRIRWEADCHRPGSDSRVGGRDSFRRVIDDEHAPSTDSMRRVWAPVEQELFHSSTPQGGKS